MRSLIIISLLISCSSYGQLDSIQLIPEVDILDTRNSLFWSLRDWDYISTEKIQELQPLDAADIIQKFAGTSIKSYGGLGGLKTVSVHGLGTNHSAIVVDGQSLVNSQSGQVNLGQLSGDNLTSVETSSGRQKLHTIPVSAQIAGNSIVLNTFENSFSKSGFQLRSSFKYGSYNHQSAYVGLKYTNANWLFSGMGTFRRADGNYDYSVQNGFQTLEGKRHNNDFLNYSFGGTIGRQGERTRFRAGYRQSETDQGLPGAVLLYNQTQNERLRTGNKTAFADFYYRNDPWIIRAYANGRHNNVRYADPDYLNAAGELIVDYLNRSISGGVVVQFYPMWDKLHFYGGVEQVVSDLHVSDTTFALPVRFHNYGILGVEYFVKKFILKAHISEQYVSERNNNGVNAQDRFRINPYASIEYDDDRKWKHMLWYRNSFRMPSFNELYYNNIGNNNLVPEDAHQLNYGLVLTAYNRTKFNARLRSNVYINFIENKIIAIPTKNLFVWSMQNIGKARVYGFETMLNLEAKFNKGWKMSIDANYSYQRSLDYTGKDSPTYKHQIAYIPLHTANFDVSVYYKKTGLRISNYFTSLRYSLNENVEQNEVEAFLITDLSIFHRFVVKEKHAISVQFLVKNVFDQSYAYIRSFVMPGRNYLISLSYAFN
ncbi:MAG: TonB-dependent receptor [Crocinitomicaceae bacterium]|nr:TonB-dependent receptor [Crocinitomicaceae bacterium]